MMKEKKSPTPKHTSPKGVRKKTPSAKSRPAAARRTERKRRTPKRAEPREGVVRRLFKRMFYRDGELSPAAIWTATGVVAVGYIVCCYFFFYRPYMHRYGHEVRYELPQVHGVDVSHHQGTIDWPRLSRALYKEDSIRFVFMKATEGGDFVDTLFPHNFSAAREQGLLRGAYHFFLPEVPADLQAANFISRVQLMPGDLPPVLDVEVVGKGGSVQLQQGVHAWLSQVERHYGVKPIIYASYKFKMRYLNDSLFNTYPYWMAHYYVPEPEYEGEWKFWQHTDLGELDGVKGDVDLNIFNGTMDELRRMTIPDASSGQR